MSPDGVMYRDVARAWNRLRRVDTDGATAKYWRAVIAYRTGSAEPGDPQELFATYVRVRPDDPRGHLGWLLVTVDDLAAEPDAEARQRGLDAAATSANKAVPAATSATALDAIARYWRLRGKPEAARPFLIRALARDRACARCYETLAGLHADRREFAAAYAAEHRAIVSSGKHGPTGSMIKALVRYRAGAALE